MTTQHTPVQTAKQLSCNTEDLLGIAPRTCSWLLSSAPDEPKLAGVIHEFVTRLNADGFQIMRANMGAASLHPEIGSKFYRWYLQDSNETIPMKNMQVQATYHTYENAIIGEIFWAHLAYDSAQLLNSPWKPIMFDRHVLLCDLTAKELAYDYAILQELAESDATAYLGFPVECISGDIHALSFATTKTGGFSDKDVSILQHLGALFTRRLEPRLQCETTSTLLTTYLGHNAGQRVLSGQIQRGDVEQIDAAIWFSDFRGFTNLANQLSPAELIAALNAYFDAMATLIQARGGEILKFIGDAILAIFPAHDKMEAAEVCAAAILTAREVNACLAALTAEREQAGLPILHHGIGLHYGTVQYGNIGSQNRLDFTVVSKAVNLASRIEGLCGKLGQQTLVSEAIATHATDETLLLENVALKGFDEAYSVYILKEHERPNNSVDTSEHGSGDS